MTAAVEVEAPKVVDGLPADEYHADRTSISSSGLRALLPPGCPAQFKYDRDNPQPPKREFDLGHAAHKLVLGEGEELAQLDFDNYLTKAAKQARDEARDAGAIPLLRHEWEQVEGMAEAIRQHPIAGPLFAPGTGRAELSLFWTDPATGVRLRVRPDWLKEMPGLALAVDYKSCRDASPEAISRAIRDRAYHQQDALYVDGIYAALKPEDVRFIFAFQSKTPPYLITVRELDEQSRDIGRARNERALRIFAECSAADAWPDWTGVVEEIPSISLPTWDAIRQAEEFLQ